MTQPSSDAVARMSLTPPEHGESLRAGPVIHRVLQDGKDVALRFAVLECRMPPGWPGPPQHVHREHDEAFFVLTGSVRFTSAQTTEVAAPGTLVTIPADVPHTFGNADEEHPASLICTVTPGRYVDYFRDLEQLQAGPDGLLQPQQILDLMTRHATEPWVAQQS